jgi:hypothetical protein
MKRWLGLDFFDLVIHAGITAAVGVVAAQMVGPLEEDSAVAFVIALSLGLLAWRRARALRRQEAAPAESGRVAELEARVSELEQAQDRLIELEERLDFAERMLVRQREQEAARLAPGERET